MKTLTTTNQRVQFFISYGDQCARDSKFKRLKRLEDDLLAKGQYITELFPRKQWQLLDEIVYNTAANGICKIGTDTLSAKIGVSARTISTFNRTLEGTGQYIIGRLRNSKTNCGKLVYVDVLHPNFKEIMRECFLLSANQIAELIAEQEEPTNVDTTPLNDEKQTRNLNILNKKTRNKNNNIYKAIRENVEEKAFKENSKEYVEQYATNSRQIAFYDLLDGMPMPKAIDDLKAVLALRIGSDCDDKRFVAAKGLIMHMALRIKDGFIYDNIVAAFTAGLLNAESYESIKQPTPTVEVPAFARYNWLQRK